MGDGWCGEHRSRPESESRGYRRTKAGRKSAAAATGNSDLADDLVTKPGLPLCHYPGLSQDVSGMWFVSRLRREPG